MTFKVTFKTPNTTEQKVVQVPEGATLSAAAKNAGLEIGQPCGGQGRCGRCAVQVISGNVRRRSTLRLTPEDLAEGFALACQSVIEGDVTVFVPEQEKIERRLTTERMVGGVAVPPDYDPWVVQTVRRYNVKLTAPSLDDQTDDWSRIQTALAVQHNLERVTASLPVLRRMALALREGDWQAQVILAHESIEDVRAGQIIDVRPGLCDERDPIWGCAIDIGTTTVSLWLVDLISGQVRAQAAEYNGQIARGEDVISRIVYASKQGVEEMQTLVVQTINGLCENACQQAGIEPKDVVKATVAGNPTMIHLLLGLPSDSIRLAPFVPVINQPASFAARELGLGFCPDALVDCLPGVASYVGADITAGVLSSGIADTSETTLFIDVGTNGEIVLGNQDWLMTCACSAGPAFEGAGVQDGMRATAGAIEDVLINGETYEPHIRVIGGGKPRGICGSGLIALLAELFLTGVVDKAGRVNLSIPSKRVRATDQGGEYVLVWSEESDDGEEIVLTRVDIDNLLRAKAAIYAGFGVLAEKVGMTLEDVQQMLIGGSFGKYVNVEKAIQIGLLPDLPWDKFKFLGNTSVKGAYLALLDARARNRIQQAAGGMTYVELSADNMFYDAFTSALFLPNTDLSTFPSVRNWLERRSSKEDVAVAAS